jgi:hypothetical protein
MNTFLTPSVIAREALMVLRNNAVMANLVHRDYSNEFVSGVGDTVTIRKPATFTAKEFNGTIEVQDAAENGVAVKMDKHLDVSFAVTAKQLSMDIKDFSAQLLVPAMQAFADKVDQYLLGLKADVTATVPASDAVQDDVVDARSKLTKAAAPLTEHKGNGLQNGGSAENHAYCAAGTVAKMANEGGVHHVVDGGHQHADDRGDRKLYHQAGHRCGGHEFIL